MKRFAQALAFALSLPGASSICDQGGLSYVVGWGSSEECGGQEIDGEPIVGDAWFGVDPVVDSQEKAAMGGSLCEKGR